MLGFFLQEIVLKYAVIGKGKTGSHIIDLLKERKLSYGVFDSQNTITPEALKDYDVAICFVNAPTFRLLKPILVHSQIPLVIGTTGIEWDESLLSEIKLNCSFALIFLFFNATKSVLDEKYCSRVISPF